MALTYHVFQPSNTDPAFKLWHNNGIISITELYSDGIFSSFAALTSKFQLPNSHLFLFFQIRDFVKKQFPHFPNRPPKTMTDTLVLTDSNQKKCISVLYNSLRFNTLELLNLIKTAWEDDPSMSLTEQQWPPP